MKGNVIMDITPFIKQKPVLNFNFSTIILFRCTRKKFAQSFREGKIFFNQPKKWIQVEKDGNKGRGDVLEGTFISVKRNDISDFVSNLKKDERLNYFDNNEFTYFRRKKIEELYCLCFYGLNDNSFTEKNIDKEGKAHYISRIDNKYFTDFSDNITKEMYENIEEKEKPVVLFISNPHKLFEKIKKFFINIGMSEDEIIISPVEYLDKKEIAISAIPYPKELLLKDKYYSKQSEIRIIVNSTNPKFIEYMKENNNTIDIGNIEDITDIYDYYFNDLLIEKNGKNSIMFNLPKPEIEDFEDMELKKLLGILLQVTTDKLSDHLKSEEKNELIQYLKNTIKNKYDIDVECDGHEINIYNGNESTFKYIEMLSKPYKKVNDFEKYINKLIEQEKYDDAINEINRVSKDLQLFNIGFYYNGIILQHKKAYKKAIEIFTYCINNEIKLPDSLSSRSNCFNRIKEYELAIKDLESLQDIIGYNPTIYVNKGINLINLGRLQNSVDEFNKSIKMNEINPQAYYNRGVAYFGLNDLNKAREDIEKALVYAPDDQFYRMEYEKFFLT